MFLFKKDLSLITRRLSFNSNTNFLFSFDSTLKFSKDGEWLQSNKWSPTALPSSLTLFLVNGEISIFSPILAHSLTAEITLKFINDIRCKFYRNVIFNTKVFFVAPINSSSSSSSWSSSSSSSPICFDP